MSCTDCESNEIKYKGNGSQTRFTFPFTYIAETDVIVSIWDDLVPGRYWVYPRHNWTFHNATTIQFNIPPGPPKDPDVFNIKISRCTDIDPLAATFYPGSSIRAQDLNDNFEQLQLAIAEGRCQVPDWLFDYLDKYYWNKGDETIYTDDLFVCDDEHIASSGAICKKIEEAIDNRIETDPNFCPGDDTHVPSTGAICEKLDDYVQYTDLILEAEQLTNGATIPPNRISSQTAFSSAASVARHDLYHQDPKPVQPPYEQPGKQWYDTATLEHYVWDANAGAWVDVGMAGPPGLTGPFGPPGKCLIGDTPPTEYPAIGELDSRPLESGDLWWDSKQVLLYVYYKDINSEQWVAVSKTGPQGPQGDKGDPGTGQYDFAEPLVNDGSDTISIDLNSIPSI